MKHNKSELYTSPKMKMVEIKTRQVVHASHTGQTPELIHDDNAYGF